MPGALSSQVRRVVLTAASSPIARFDWVDRPDLSVVIVTYGTGSVIDRCLASVSRVAQRDGVGVEIVVVDNLHPDLATWSGDRLCLLTEGVRLVRTTENLGFGGGNEVGVEVARSDLICLLNPDAMLAAGQLCTLVQTARDHPDRIVAPGFINSDGSVQELGQRLIANGETRPIVDVGSYPVDYASAACWLLHRELFEAVGGFDRAFHPAYYEDVDFVLRARDLGFDLLLRDDIRVVHTQHGSSSEEPDVARQRAAFAQRWADLIAARPSG